MIIYTANYGGKDKLREPRIADHWKRGIKFVYFTDQPIESQVWDVIVEKKQGDSNRLAKWYKINSHEVFPGEDTLWIDSSILLYNDPTKFFDGWDDMLLRKHRKRNDIYEEAKVCISSGRDAVGVKEQVAEYKRQGFPEKSGLYINGILFRKSTERTTELNKAWWEQICRYSVRDQISLPYVLRDKGFTFSEVEYKHFGRCFSKPAKHIRRGTKEPI